MRRAIVVGGGPAGLAASTYLARAGWEVRVLEGARELGGRARTRLEAGSCLNLGPHALYLGGWAKRVLDELGVVAAGGEPLASHVLLGERLERLPLGLLSLLQTGALSWRGKLEVARLMSALPSMKCREVGGSFQAWVEATLQTPNARALLLALGRLSTYAHAPTRLPASLALEQLQISLAGVRYLDGGWASMVDELAERARASGVEIELEARVRSLGSEGRSVSLAGGRELEAEGIVLALPSRAARRLLGPERVLLPEATPLHAACLDLVLRREGLERRTGFALGIDRPLYVSIHSEAARLGPEVVVHAARYLDPEVREDPSELRAELEASCDLLYPNWRGQALAQVFAPHLEVVGDLPRGGLAARPSVDALGPGLALCGDWVGPEGWLLDASLASARAAAEALSRAPAAAAASMTEG